MAKLESSRFYSVPEVAELLSVGYRTVLAMIARRELHAVRVGGRAIRVPGWAIEAFAAGERPGELVTSTPNQSV